MSFANVNRYWAQPRSVPFRTGIVAAQQMTPYPAVRVTFPDRDNIQSYWLPIVGRGSQNDKDFWLPDIGEQVNCVMDENDENGAVFGAIFSTADGPPSGMSPDKRHFLFKDGTSIEYDRSAHVYSINLGAGGSATLNTPLGNSLALGADGTVTLQDHHGTVLKLTGDGYVTITGGLRVSGDVVWSYGNQNYSGSGHLHSNVQSGSGDTGPPVANT